MLDRKGTMVSAPQREPQLFGMPLKYVSLGCLVFQNSSLVICMRYSRIVEGPMYLSSTAVVMSEVIKLIACLGLIFATEGSLRAWKERIVTDIFNKETLKLGIPAVLYTLQNNLQYVAASNLDAAVFQVTYQLKILTTALFSVMFLRKLLTRSRWISLFVLTCGVALVQLPPDAISSLLGGAAGTPGPSKEHEDMLTGLIAVLSACVLSGLAGVYFEMILKESDMSVWMRNVQLGFFGVVIGLFGAYVKDGALISQYGFFYGYSTWTWLSIGNQALGGLLVAVVVKYADNILKGYATSLSIIISSIISVYLFDFQLSAVFALGSSLVCLAVYLYSL